MQRLKARIVNGHMVVDQPTKSPERTQPDLAITESGDDLDGAERAALHATLTRAWENVRAGKGSPAEDRLRKLRADR